MSFSWSRKEFHGMRLHLRFADLRNSLPYELNKFQSSTSTTKCMQVI